MADNTTLNSGSGGDTLATDDIGGVKFPRSKIVIGADGTNDGDVSSGNPMPVAGTVDLGATDNAVLDAIAASLVSILAGQLADGHNVTVDNASIAITASSLPLPSGAATAANQSTANGLLTTIDADTGSLVTIANAIAGYLDTEVAAILSALQGTLTVDGSGVTQPVSGTVTANLSAVDNAVLDTIDAVLDTINAKLVTGTVIGDVNVASSLPAGTNAIGKLAANDGVDIGDVDVTSLPGELSGPGTPTIDSYTSDDVNVAADTANQQLVAAPGADKQIWVYGFVGTTSAAGSISLQDEDDTELSGVMPLVENGGFAISPNGNFAMPWLKVPTNKALEIDTVTCAFDGVISYAIVSV